MTKRSATHYFNTLQSDALIFCDITPDLLVAFDSQMAISWCNSAWRTLGYEPGKMVGVNLIDLFHAHDAARILRAITQQASGESDWYRIMRRDIDAVSYIKLRGRRHTQQRHHLVMFDGSQMITTATRVIAQERGLVEQYYQSVFAQSHGATFVVSAEKKIAFVIGVEKVLGWAAHEMRGRSLWNFVAPEDRTLIEFALRADAEPGRKVKHYFTMMARRGFVPTPLIAVEAAITDSSRDPIVNGYIFNIAALDARST